MQILCILGYSKMAKSVDMSIVNSACFENYNFFSGFIIFLVQNAESFTLRFGTHVGYIIYHIQTYFLDIFGTCDTFFYF
jgi:hypothetical protein